MDRKVLYSRNVIFKEVNPSPKVVQPKDNEKKPVVQLPPKIDKNKPKSER
jgi:hypothetical protein